MRTPKNKLWLIFAVILADQLAKFFVIRLKLFSNTLIENPDLAFGLKLPGFFGIVLVVAVLGLFVWLYWRNFHSGTAQIGFALVVGGACSNLLSRVFQGAVPDFLNLGVSTVNLADLFILAGMVILLFSN